VKAKRRKREVVSERAAGSSETRRGKRRETDLGGEVVNVVDREGLSRLEIVPSFVRHHVSDD